MMRTAVFAASACVAAAATAIVSAWTTYSVSGPAPSFMRGSGRTLSAQWKTNRSSPLAHDTYIYIYPVNSDAYVEKKRVPGKSGTRGSVQFNSATLAIGKRYVFRWHNGVTFFGNPSSKLAESDPFVIREFEEVMHQQVQKGIAGMDAEIAALKRRVSELEEQVKNPEAAKKARKGR